MSRKVWLAVKSLFALVLVVCGLLVLLGVIEPPPPEKYPQVVIGLLLMIWGSVYDLEAPRE